MDEGGVHSHKVRVDATTSLPMKGRTEEPTRDQFARTTAHSFPSGAAFLERDYLQPYNYCHHFALQRRLVHAACIPLPLCGSCPHRVRRPGLTVHGQPTPRDLGGNHFGSLCRSLLGPRVARAFSCPLRPAPGATGAPARSRLLPRLGCRGIGHDIQPPGLRLPLRWERAQIGAGLCRGRVLYLPGHGIDQGAYGHPERHGLSAGS